MNVFSFISWRAIFAGALVTMAVYSTLLFLGVGIGASAAVETIQRDGTITDLGKGTATYVTVATLLSLAAGGFFAARTSTFLSRWIGAAQGLVIASLFLMVMIYGVGSTLGAGLRGMASAVETGAGGLANSTLVQNTVEDGLLGMAFKTDTSTVVRGVVARLAAGNTESARNYLISQSNVPADIVNERFTTMEAQFRETAKSVATTTAEGVSTSGYGMFWISLFGILCACAGGAAGSHLNLKNPMVVEVAETTARYRPAV